jgi:hypothetical protein
VNAKHSQEQHSGLNDWPLHVDVGTEWMFSVRGRIFKTNDNREKKLFGVCSFFYHQLTSQMWSNKSGDDNSSTIL